MTSPCPTHSAGPPCTLTSATGRVTSRELVRQYLERIGTYEDRLHAVITVNPDALKIATAKIAEAPKLIPIHSHRYIPEEPHESGNPVFSVHQMDVIYYGFDLDDYLRHEFNLAGRKEWPAQVRPIRFWDPDRFQKLRWDDT